MKLFNDLQEASRAVTTFMMFHGTSLPAHTRDKILDAMAQPSVVDNLMKTLEALYAARDELNDDGKTLVAQIAEHVTPLGWHGIRDDNRGPGIQMAMQRDLGEKAPGRSAWPKPEEDPAAKAEYLPPTESGDDGAGTSTSAEPSS